MDQNELGLRYRFAQGVVREAGQMALDRYRRRESLAVERKGRQDFVSEADKACEAFVAGALLKAFPEDSFLGEEGGLQNAGSAATWIIDPIDGTSNFIAGIPIWCVSLGLVIGSQSVLGIIYNPATEDLYAARAGEGAYLNGKRIRVSGARRLEEARMGLGFSYRRPVQDHVKAVSACLEASCEYTRFGSGALGMAFAADGRLDGYYEAHINAWDVAAGLVLMTEAGGWCSDFFGAPDTLIKGNVILAAAPGLVEPLRKLLAV
ncbi:inositol monophosphatase family protein [Dongia deserti]|uniref:inositol monophosphatase family protein n=1 Tax=Dongia deserti TaxID=2268030 RepID=UPI000E654539|nr:inositol monophosphatase family protein [Dongia deserti]